MPSKAALRHAKVKRKPTATTRSGRDRWERFLKDPALLESHGVTDEELKFLSSVSLFGKLKSVDDVLFILANIRAATRKTQKAKDPSEVKTHLD